MILLLAAALASAPLCPESATQEAFVCRALEASRQGQADAAASAFEEAARVSSPDDPARARLWAAAGNMWIAAGQPGKAALVLDRALEGAALQSEQRGEALLDRARAAEAQNDLKTARRKLTEAAASISEDPFYWYFSAALAIREGDKQIAQTSINRALSLAPGDPTILFEAGHVAHFRGDEAAARDYWTRAVAADRDGPSGKAAKEALELLAVPVTAAPAPAKSE